MQVFKRSGRSGYYARWQVNGVDFVRATGESWYGRAMEALKRFVSERDSSDALGDAFRSLLLLLESPDHASRLSLHVASARRVLTRVVESLPSGERERAMDSIAREFRHAHTTRLRIVNSWTTWRASANREMDPKARTLQGYEAMWRRFQTWAVGQSLNHLDEVTRAHAESYAVDLWKSRVSPSTFNQHLKLIRGVFQSLQHQMGLEGNPWSHLKSRKRSLDEGRRNLTEAEL